MLPSAVVGMNLCIETTGADGSATVRVDCDAGDHFEYDGTVMSDGEYIYNSSDKKGDVLCFLATTTAIWKVIYGGETTVAEQTP